MTEAQKRAKIKYRKTSIKRMFIDFYPADHELYEIAKKSAKKYGGINRYIKELILKDNENNIR